MAKINKGDIENYWERKRMQNVVRSAGRIEKIYAKAANRMAGYFNQIKPTDDLAKTFTKNKRIEQKIDSILDDFQNEVTQEFRRNFEDGWQTANDKHDDVLADYLKGLAIGKELKRGMFDRNMKAMETFLDEGVYGQAMSNRVWDLRDQFKKQIKFFAASGIGTGRDSRKIARDLKKYLQEPDKRFRRVRDPETGKLKLSQPAKDYHPGRGVYRSSYMNALRYSATEHNRAFRYSDYHRIQNEPFVTGIEIKLSNAHPRKDICDYQVGKYPKGYKFGGFHPFCICYQTTVTLGPKEFAQYMKSGKVPEHKFINNIPSNAQQYLNERADKLSTGSTPYFVRDNFDVGSQSVKPKNGVYPMGRKRINDVKQVGAEPEVRQLTKAEKDSIVSYQDTAYIELNENLRKGASLKDEQKHLFGKIQSGIRHSTKFSGTVYRGAVIDNMDDVQNLQSQLDSGYVRDQAFMSTSKAEDVADYYIDDALAEIEEAGGELAVDVKFIIKAKGKHGIDLTEFSDQFAEEKEVLFESGTNFKVSNYDIDDEDQSITVYLEEL